MQAGLVKKAHTHLPAHLDCLKKVLLPTLHPVWEKMMKINHWLVLMAVFGYLLDFIQSFDKVWAQIYSYEKQGKIDNIGTQKQLCRKWRFKL